MNQDAAITAKLERILAKCQVCDKEKYQRIKHLEMKLSVILELLEACRNLMDYLAFMTITRNKKYPFRPGPEGLQTLKNLEAAIVKSEEVIY